jgi:hypothetical protein
VVLAPPHLVAPVRRKFRFPAVLRWWHLLSLDAPTVAALWSWSLARAVHLHLPWKAPLLLALGTWLVYVADRILDGLRGARSELRERHFFSARHRNKMLAVASIVWLLVLWLIVFGMNPAPRREDLVLFAAALIYFALIHLPSRNAGVERWFPKEIAVAVIFASAVAVPAWSRLAGHRVGLVPLVAIFASICWLNCVAIEKWERASAGLARVLNTGRLHASTRWAHRHLRILCLTIALGAAIAALQSILFNSTVITVLYLACAISALLLFVFDRSPIGNFDLRIAADAALLTPLLMVAVLRG